MPSSLLWSLFAWLIQQHCSCQAQTSFGINNSFTDSLPFDDWSNTTNTYNTDNNIYYHGPFGRTKTLSRSFVIDTSLISSTYSYLLTLSYQVLLACNIEGSDRVKISIIVDGNSESDKTLSENDASMTQSNDNPFSSVCTQSSNSISRSKIINQSVILYGNDIINNGSDNIEISIYGSFSAAVTTEFWMIGQIVLSIESQSASPTTIPTYRPSKPPTLLPSLFPTFLPTSSPIFHTIDGNKHTVFCGSNWTNCTILCKSLVTKKIFCVLYFPAVCCFVFCYVFCCVRERCKLCKCQITNNKQPKTNNNKDQINVEIVLRTDLKVVYFIVQQQSIVNHVIYYVNITMLVMVQHYIVIIVKMLV